MAMVEHAAPVLPVERVEVLRQSPDWVVAEVNAEYVFHFARTAKAIAWLAAEDRLLAAISGRISTRLPEPWRTAPDNTFTAYRRIGGQPLGSRAFDGSLSEAAWGRVAAGVGAFLAELHQAVDLDTAIGLHLPPADYQPFQMDLLRRTLPLMCSEEDRDLVRRVDRLLREVLPDLNSPVQTHGDLHGDNLLVADDGTLVGVLDFRAAAVADRHLDFRCLFGYGDIMEGAVETYNRASPVPVDLRSCQILSAANDLEDMTWREETGMVPVPIPIRAAGLRERLRVRGLL